VCIAKGLESKTGNNVVPTGSVVRMDHIRAENRVNPCFLSYRKAWRIATKKTVFSEIVSVSVPAIWIDEQIHGR
jgi:hypothetical protein